MANERFGARKGLGRPGNSYVKIPSVFSVASLHTVLAYIHYVVRKERWKEVPLDFSSCTSVLESAMLPMIPIINSYMTELNVRFEVVLPKNESLKNIFLRSNWAHFIDPFKYQYVEDVSATHCPVIRFSTAQEQFNAVDRVLSVILRSANVSDDTLAAIEWSLNEISDNVINHAGTDISGFLQATFFTENKVVEFVVADAGMGIPRSLKEKDNCLALEKAIQEGVTRNRETNMGNGLFGSYRIAEVAGGAFSIMSQSAWLSLTPGGTVRIRPTKSPYAGTAIAWNMRTDRSDIVARALRFSGKSYEPPFVFLDRISGETGQIHLGLKAAFPSLGSRNAGARVHTYLRNLLASERIVAVEIDFSGINIITSSFADEVFGRLFNEIGPISFMSRINLSNAGPSILGLINRAIVQRSATGPIR